jgi:hypothetical protein
VLVTIAAAIWIVGTSLGSGWFGGGGVDSQGNGLFSDSTTLIAPMGPAFSIWSVIYVGLLGFGIWQWIPGAAKSEWARVSRLPAAVSIALNGTWLLVVFAGWVGVSVLVILGIAAALGIVLHRTARLPAEGWAPQVWVALTFGLYLGWICVATCANIALWLVDLGVAEASGLAVGLTIAVLVVVIGLVAFLLSRTRQPLFQAALAAAVVWGISWVSAGRFLGELPNATIGYAAAVAAVVVAALGLIFVVRSSRNRGVIDSKR